MMWILRILNRVGLRRDVLACMRQSDTWCWPRGLGKMTPGICDKCGHAVYFERQNRVFAFKICNRCKFGPAPLCAELAKQAREEQ